MRVICIREYMWIYGYLVCVCGHVFGILLCKGIFCRVSLSLNEDASISMHVYVLTERILCSLLYYKRSLNV